MSSTILRHHLKYVKCTHISSHPCSVHAHQISEDSLEKIIMGGNSKSCRLESHAYIPPKINTTYSTSCPVYNKSLACGVMPNSFKISTVTPLLKKPCLGVENFKNFLCQTFPYIEKLIEKVAVSQMDTHMTDHNLHEIYQSAQQNLHF